MNSFEREQLINRICSGCMNLKGNLYTPPSQKIRFKADIVYEKNLKDGLTHEDALELLREQGRWNDLLDKEIRVDIPKVMEQLKLEIYLNYDNKETVAKLKGKLAKVKERLITLLSIKRSYDEYTVEYAADREKTLYLIKKCVKSCISPELLLSSFYANQINDDKIREIARSSEWSVKWTAFKKGMRVFSKNLTQEQEILVKWSSLYDNILEQQDCPSDEIIEDDDALDGWLIWKRKENERNRGIDEIENRIKDKNAQEVYLPVNVDKNGFQKAPIFESKPEFIEEARKIAQGNSAEANRIKAQRFNQISAQGEVKEFEMKDGRLVSNFQDNQMKLLLARNNSGR